MAGRWEDERGVPGGREGGWADCGLGAAGQYGVLIRVSFFQGGNGARVMQLREAGKASKGAGDAVGGNRGGYTQSLDGPPMLTLLSPLHCTCWWAGMSCARRADGPVALAGTVLALQAVAACRQWEVGGERGQHMAMLRHLGHV